MNYILILFFLCVAYLWGGALIRLLQFKTRLPLLLSGIVGLASLNLLIFLFSFVVPFTKNSVLVELVIIGGVALFLLRPKLVFPHIKPVKISRSLIVELLILVFIAGLFTWLFANSLFIDTSGGIVAGNRLVWTDWPVHIGIASSFAWGQNIPPGNPTFASIALVYPFFADFFSAILLVLGAGYPLAFAIPGVVLGLSFCAIFSFVAYTMLRSSAVFVHLSAAKQRILAYSALFMSLFWGGLGFLYWLQEAFSDELLLVERLVYPPREYTFWGEKGLWFFTFLYSEILPQRAFLFGLPLFFLTLLLLLRAWEKRVWKWSFAAGVIAGLLPFFHTHSFISMWIFTGTCAVLGTLAGWFRPKHWKNWWRLCFSFFAPFLILTLIQLPLYQSHFSLPFEFGWMKGKLNFFWFWFINTGFFWPLWILGMWKGKFSSPVKLIGWGSLMLFILPNIFRFAPWGYDNLKILTYWYLLGSVFVIAGLVVIARSVRFVGPILAVGLFLSLTLSGVIEVSRLADRSRTQIGLWGKEDQKLAQLIREQTSPSAVFLAAAIHDHPVTALAGRKIVIGYPGNSWSWGIEGWSQREQDVHTMFRGGEEATDLWKKYGIDYIIVSDRERWFDKNIAEKYIADHTQLFISEGNTKIYKVK